MTSGPGLLILTGASHTGKSAVGRAILSATPPPAALLSVDAILASTIARPPRDPWAEIPLAYDLLHPQLEILLDRGWLVVVESTFTLIPEDGSPQFHNEQLAQTIAIADDRQISWLLVQMATDLSAIRDRAEHTGRLAIRIVEQTAALHQAIQLPKPMLRLDSTNRMPDELGQVVLKEFDKVIQAS